MNKYNDLEMINRNKLLNFINDMQNIYGMSYTYPDGWIKVKDLLDFINKNKED